MKLRHHLFALSLLLCGWGHAAESELPPLLIERVSPLGFDETLTTLEHNARQLGWKVPSKWKIDFQKNLLKTTGTDVGRNQVIKMCEPKAAAALLKHDRFKQLAAMMPCTIAVYEKSDGRTYIASMNLQLLGSLYGGEAAELVQQLAPQMETMLQIR